MTWAEEVDVSGDRECILIPGYICKAVIHELQFNVESAPDLPAAPSGLQARLFNDALASSFKQIITVTHWLLCPASTLGLCSSAHGDSAGAERRFCCGPGFCLRQKQTAATIKSVYGNCLNLLLRVVLLLLCNLLRLSLLGAVLGAKKKKKKFPILQKSLWSVLLEVSHLPRALSPECLFCPTTSLPVPCCSEFHFLLLFKRE